MTTTLTLYHVGMNANRDVSDALRFPGCARGLDMAELRAKPNASEILSNLRAEIALEFFQNGDVYEHIATITVEQEGLDALEEAYRLTQNGVVSSSWSRLPPPGVEPAGDGFIAIFDEEIQQNREYGYRSTDIGDLIQTPDGKLHVVDSFGFTELPEPQTPTFKR
jgi:hypothetical protein